MSEIERPVIKKRCKRCLVAETDWYVVISPTGTAHHGKDDGYTECGIDATGQHWWWPL